MWILKKNLVFISKLPAEASTEKLYENKKYA